MKKPRVPDAPCGLRFCTSCDRFLPVSEFPRGPRRYSCKTHMWANAGKKAKVKMMADTNKSILFRLWGKAYDDSTRFSNAWGTLDGAGSQTVKNQARVSITQREIEQLLCTATDYSPKEAYDYPTEFARHIAVVPVNPNALLSLSNAALAHPTVKRQLFRAFKLDGLAGYNRTFREVGSDPENIFVPSQEQLDLMRSAMNPVLESGCAKDNCGECVVVGGGKQMVLFSVIKIDN